VRQRIHSHRSRRRGTNIAARIAIAWLLLVPASGFALTLHVSPEGNDHAAGAGAGAGAGTAEAPFATLEGARQAIRALKHAGPLREAVTVLLHRGTYALDATFELGQADSGTQQFPIVWTAAPNEAVRITGGPAIAGEEFHAITDAAIAARLAPSARPHVLQLDLKPHLNHPPPEYPDTFRGAPAAPELFFNDQRMTVARWPNRGWATIAGFVETGSIPRDGDTAGRLGAFTYSGDEPARWNVATGVWLQGYWAYDWYDETIRIKSIDLSKKQITLAAPALYGVKRGNPSPRRFRALNVLEELDEPGEFYIDPAPQILYFWPPQSVDGARVVLSTLNSPLLRLTDAGHLTIRGITFEASLADGIDIAGGSDDCIDGCTVRNTRELGIHVTGGTHHRITNCSITDTGAGGLILAGGDRKTLTPAGHAASNNHIWNFSRHQFTGAYGLILGGVGNLAAHNHIHEAPHQAILIDGNDHVFEYNVVDHVVTETDDAGALYKGRNPSCRGNIIRYNFWSDMGSAMGHGTAAIYFDDGDGGDLVLGNIFVRCGNPGAGPFGTIFSHGGHGLRAVNNMFVDCPRALGSVPWDDARWKNALEGGQDYQFPEKLLKEVDITRPPYTTRYPELIGFMHPKPGAPRNSYASNNVLVRCPDATAGNWKSDPSTMWSTDQDPGFVDAAHGNYQLRADSPVFQRLPGFERIPFAQIGMKESP
jgi:hypothetical protein